ncbi:MULTISPECIES: GAF domain-containing protein [unclassified Coleofasciculus]|uniref:GAF domain-containing protein n=1 Tax=unclassified Coleofasciculus TaxID=2692782 RepID=UPI00187F5930|nr:MULTISPECIES: GAF domain-containing protein [unclassified Coleofasciculus]MBE9127798.1 GAF domain-containing protein [Coleofasciculus sp. LEGE 07081]MBE9150039.1 GAF domain-containing protein [Coleofasciculus sp. LEGE 07092]
MSKTLSVHPRYIQEVERVWKYKSNEREPDLPEKLGRSLPIVIDNLFLKGQPVNRHNFLQICQILGLDWQEVAGLEVGDAQSTSLSALINSCTTQANSSPDNSLNTVDDALNDLVRTLCEMLGRLTRRAGDLLRADRTSIFLLDRSKKEAGSLIAEDGQGGSLMIDIPMNRGIVGLAAMSSKVVNIPFDVYDDPRSEQAKKTDQRTGYRTYTILAWPLLNNQQEVVAVVQFINKLNLNYDPKDDLFKRINTKGFAPEDEVVFAKFAPSILGILGKCQLCYQLAQKLKDNQEITRGGVALTETELITELRQREQQLLQNLSKW